MAMTPDLSIFPELGRLAELSSLDGSMTLIPSRAYSWLVLEARDLSPEMVLGVRLDCSLAVRLGFDVQHFIVVFFERYPADKYSVRRTRINCSA